MSKTAVQSLTEASDLLLMLEELMLRISRPAPEKREVPWEGMKLTVQQVRERIQRATEEMLTTLYADEIDTSVLRPAVNGSSARNGTSSLASRIRRVPSGGGKA